MLFAAITTATTASHTVNQPVLSSGGFDLAATIQQWLPLIFMGILVGAIVLLVRAMPRTRPEQIRPDTTPTITITTMVRSWARCSCAYARSKRS